MQAQESTIRKIKLLEDKLRQPIINLEMNIEVLEGTELEYAKQSLEYLSMCADALKSVREFITERQLELWPEVIEKGVKLIPMAEENPGK